MDKTVTVYGMIEDIVEKKTRFLRHYTGKVVVNSDPLGKGRIKATVPFLGWDKIENSSWLWPRQMNSLSTPDLNTYVEIYFINGDEDIPVYIGQASEFTDNIPEAYDKFPTTHVIFEAPKRKDYIKYDDLLGHLEISINDSKAGKGIDLKVGMPGAIINIEGSTASTININPGSGGMLNLGSSPLFFVNNLPACLFTGSPHSTSIDTKA